MMATKRKGKQMVQVVLLRQILRKFLNAHKAVANGCFGLLGKERRYFCLEREEEGPHRYVSSRTASALPSDVPKGHLAVYVGKDRSRFIIPTTYLNHYIFRTLLENAEQEFGFDHQMGLTIPCQQDMFQDLISLLEKKHNPSLSNRHLDRLIDCTHSIS